MIGYPTFAPNRRMVVKTLFNLSIYLWCDKGPKLNPAGQHDAVVGTDH
jgi:hypothetical protein